MNRWLNSILEGLNELSAGLFWELGNKIELLPGSGSIQRAGRGGGGQGATELGTAGQEESFCEGEGYKNI